MTILCVTVLLVFLLDLFFLSSLCKCMFLCTTTLDPVQRHNTFAQRLQIFRPIRIASARNNGLKARERAETYLRRIIGLTGARRVGDYYVLDIDQTRFLVNDRYIERFYLTDT